MTSWTGRLLVANALMFFVAPPRTALSRALTFVPVEFLSQPWTIVTYMFLHGSFTHLFFNLLVLFFFGPRLEDRLGGGDFLGLYFYSGLGGAAFSLVFARYAAVVGASGAVFGILLAFAMYWPREKIWIWGIFPVEARFLAGALILTSLWSGIAGAQSGVAHFAHLGGLAFGWGYLKWRERKKRPRKVEQPNSHYLSKGASDWVARERWDNIAVAGLHEINRAEIQVLLQRVDAEGIKALTLSERDFLDRMANL